MEQKEKNVKFLFYIIVGVVLLIGITLVATYAFFTVTTTKTSTLGNINSATECIDYNYPISDSFALSKITPVTVTVTNNCTNNASAIPYTLAITSLKKSSGYISDSAIRLNVSRKVGSNAESTLKSTNYLNSLTSLTSGNAYTYLMNDLNSRNGMSSYTTKDSYLIDSSTVANNSINTYKIYLWIDYYEGDTTKTGLNNNTTQGLDFASAISLVVNSN